MALRGKAWARHGLDRPWEQQESGCDQGKEKEKPADRPPAPPALSQIEHLPQQGQFLGFVPLKRVHRRPQITEDRFHPALPERMENINSLLEVLPYDVSEFVLIEYLNNLMVTGGEG